MISNTSSRVTSSFFWSLFEKFGAQAVTLVVSIVLARILDPTVYGTIAIVTLFTTILQVFVDSGFGSALVQKKNSDILDFSTIFWFNIASCAILYLLIFVIAPFISAFFGNDDLTLVIRVMSIIVVISGLKNIQQAYVSKHLLFKKFFFATIGGTLTAAIVGIWMAFSGFGVWALVFQYLINQSIDTILLWILVKWKPKMVFSMDRFKQLFSFGWKILASSMLETIYNEARQFIIGANYSSNDLAFYNRGQQFPNIIATNVNTAIDSVLLPVMSNNQDDVFIVKRITRRSIRISFFVMTPIMVLLAVCAEPIISIVLTDKWLPSIIFMQIFCFSFMLYPIHSANLNAIKALGRSDLFLILEVIKKVIGILLIAVSMFISVEAMAVSFLISSIFSAIVNSWPNRKLIGYTYREQIMDILPQLLIGIIMAVFALIIGQLSFSNNWVKLLVQLSTGLAFYFGLAYLFKIESLNYCFKIFKSIIFKNKRNV